MGLLKSQLRRILSVIQSRLRAKCLTVEGESLIIKYYSRGKASFNSCTIKIEFTDFPSAKKVI
jgi:predicted nucleic-acid-binding protein